MESGLEVKPVLSNVDWNRSPAGEGNRADARCIPCCVGGKHGVGSCKHKPTRTVWQPTEVHTVACVVAVAERNRTVGFPTSSRVVVGAAVVDRVANGEPLTWAGLI